MNHRQAIADEINRRSTRNKVADALRASNGIAPKRCRLREVMDAHYSPYALSGSPMTDAGKRTGQAVKKVAKKSVNVAKKEIVAPAKSIKRAVSYKKKANEMRAQGRIGRAAEMHTRGNAVLRNRGAQLGGAVAGAAAGATAGAFVPGATEVGAVMASKAAKKVTSKLRARHVLRTASAMA